MATRRLHALVLGAALLLCACRSETEAPPKTQPSPAAGLPASTAPVAEVAKPAPHPLRKPRRPILTGGCRDRCRSPEDAARSFVESLRAGSVDALVPLLEASLLVVEGQAHGPRWVRLWRGRELDTRREEIAAVARTLAERWKEQPFGAPALTGNEKRRQVVVPLPDGRTFRFELSLRGLEWLVSRVEAVE